MHCMSHKADEVSMLNDAFDSSQPVSRLAGYDLPLRR